MKRALIIGSSGQDGSYLAEQLQARGYVVAGISRSAVIGPLEKSASIDIRDAKDVQKVLAEFVPTELYYLAAFHHASEDLPLKEHDLVRRSFEVNSLAPQNFLDAIASGYPHCRFFYAASSHVFGEPADSLQDETTPFNPSCAYGISKTAGVYLSRYYRHQHGVFSSVGILYNHESPRRPVNFVFRKVIKTAVDISRRRQDKLTLGSLDVCIDWGYAPDYVDAMWRILQLDAPDDFVVSSGELHSIRELVEVAFHAVGLDWRDHVEIDPSIVRKGRSSVLKGNNSKLRSVTGWGPAKPFREIVDEIVKAEIQNES